MTRVSTRVAASISYEFLALNVQCTDITRIGKHFGPYYEIGGFVTAETVWIMTFGNLAGS